MTEPLSAIGLPRISSKLLRTVAAGLKITQLDTGATSLWRPNSEQLELMDSADRFVRRYITKPRRIGASTELDLEDALWTMICDAAGHRVRCGVFLHVEDKAKERIFSIGSLLQQMGAECKIDTFTITFPRMGSEIVGVTAGAKAASRSEGYQRARYEEYAFYKPGAMGEISPSVGQGASETIVTTIDIAGQNGLVAREMWRAQNDFEKIFFPFERHDSYRTDAEKISEAQWVTAQKERKFRSRAHAAYWLTEIVPNKCEGDVTRAMREYPVVEEDMFSSSKGRVIEVTPPHWLVGEVLTVPGISGEVTWKVQIRGAREVSLEGVPTGDIVVADTSGQLLMAIDTSGARGKSRSAVLVMDKRDARIIATFASDSIWEDDLAFVAKMVQERFRYAGAVPLCLIEDNGIGTATIHAAERIGLQYMPFHQDEATSAECIAQAKRTIEGMNTDGPIELAEECDELHVEVRGEKTQYKGRKDLIMCYGMCLVQRRVDGYRATIPTVDLTHMHRRMAQEIAMKRQTEKPPWGT